MKTVKFTAVIGVNEGYSLENQKEVDIEKFNELYKEIAQKVYAETGQYVSATTKAVRVLYSAEWGCPVGGENAVEVSGVCNPTFSDIEAWKDAARKVILKLKEVLKQSTVTMEWREIEIDYLQ